MWSQNGQNKPVTTESKSVVAWFRGLTADRHEATFLGDGNVLHFIDWRIQRYIHLSECILLCFYMGIFYNM